MILELMRSCGTRTGHPCLHYSKRESQNDLHAQQPLGAEWLEDDQVFSGVLNLPQEEGGAHRSCSSGTVV